MPTATGRETAQEKRDRHAAEADARAVAAITPAQWAEARATAPSFARMAAADLMRQLADGKRYASADIGTFSTDGEARALTLALRELAPPFRVYLGRTTTIELYSGREPVEAWTVRAYVQS